MPEILTYNTPPEIEKERIKQPFYKSFFDWFSSRDKFTKLYLITFTLIILSTPFIVNSYLEQRTSATVSIVNLIPNNVTRVGSPSNYSWACYCSSNSFSVVLYHESWVSSRGTATTYYEVWVRGTEQSVFAIDSRWRKKSGSTTYYGRPTNLQRGRWYWAVYAWGDGPLGSSSNATFYINSLW